MMVSTSFYKIYTSPQVYTDFVIPGNDFVIPGEDLVSSIVTLEVFGSKKYLKDPFWNDGNF